MKTIREIANELGVDKQKVYRFIKQNHINEAHHEALQRSGVKYYDEAAETLIKQGFSDETASSEAHHEAHQNRINEAVFDAVIEMLQKELEIKLDMLERHLPKQLLHLVDKARELLPDHQTYSQEKPHERGHSWGDMSL